MFQKTKLITAIHLPCCDSTHILFHTAALGLSFDSCKRNITHVFLCNNDGDELSDVVVAQSWSGVCVLQNTHVTHQPPLPCYFSHSVSFAPNYQSFCCLPSYIFFFPSISLLISPLIFSCQSLPLALSL